MSKIFPLGQALRERAAVRRPVGVQIADAMGAGESPEEITRRVFGEAAVREAAILAETDAGERRIQAREHPVRLYFIAPSFTLGELLAWTQKLEAEGYAVETRWIRGPEDSRTGKMLSVPVGLELFGSRK